MKSRLDQLMHKARFSYRALAKACKMNPSTLFRIASGDQDVRLSTAFAICQALSVRLRTPVSVYDLYPNTIKSPIVSARQLRSPAPVPGEASDVPPPCGTGDEHDGQ